MTLTAKGRLFQSEASRTLIYVSQKLVSDSAWPFQPGEDLHLRIEGDRLIVEKGEKGEKRSPE